MLITFETGITGLTPGYKILNADKSQYQARTTVGITDLGGGTYAVTVADATLAGRTVVWDTGETTPRYASETFPAQAAVDITPVLDALAAVQAKTDTLGSLAVTVTSPVAASGTITLSANDDYHTAHGRSIPFDIDDPTHALGLDDVDASVELRCSQATWTATAVETTGGYHVDFEIPHAGLTRSGHYQLKCLLADGDVVTRAKGEIVLERDIPAVPEA